jgi:hypothetical protein
MYKLLTNGLYAKKFKFLELSYNKLLFDQTH